MKQKAKHTHKYLLVGWKSLENARKGGTLAVFELIVCIIAAVVLSSFISRFIPKVSTPLVQIALGALASQLPFFPNVTLDPEGFRVEVAGAEVVLLKKEFDILSYLMQRPGHMVDKAVLAEAVWGDHADQADNFHFVYSQLKNLRRKLEEAGATIEIKAVYGFGYKLSVTE